jgi:hydrogenase maturation factor
MRVVSGAGGELECRDAGGTRHTVALELVAPVSEGEQVLVHAGVAIGRLA